MSIELRRIDVHAPSEHPVCVVAHRSPVGAHVALSYQSDSSGSRRFLHQAWHYRTYNHTPSQFSDSVTGALVMIEPALDEEEVWYLRGACNLIARHVSANTLPYAFQPRDAAFQPDGSIALGTSLGLTCATFLMKVFERARVDLLVESSWETIEDPERLRADRSAQELIVGHLRKTAEREPDPRARAELIAHADAVAKQIESPRIRAEEVAAASGLKSRPATYTAAESEGQVVLTAVSQTA